MSPNISGTSFLDSAPLKPRPIGWSMLNWIGVSTMRVFIAVALLDTAYVTLLMYWYAS